MKRPRKLIDVHKIWCGDDHLTVRELEEKLATIKHKYGANTVIVLDAGYNNVSVLVSPSRKKLR